VLNMCFISIVTLNTFASGLNQAVHAIILMKLMLTTALQVRDSIRATDRFTCIWADRI